MVDSEHIPNAIKGDPEKVAAYEQAWNEVKSEVRDDLSASTHGVPASRIKQEGVLQKALSIYRASQNGGTDPNAGGRNPAGRLDYNPGGQYDHIPGDIRMTYTRAHENRLDGRSLVEYANDQLGAGTTWEYTEDGTTKKDLKDDPEIHGDPVTGEDAKTGESTRVEEEDTADWEDAEPGDPVPDGGLTTGSDDSSDSDSWDYPDAVDTPLEKQAWRDAGGEYAKAQRLITKRKNSGGGSGEPADDSGGEKSQEKPEDDDEGGLTTGGDGSQSDDSDSSDSGDSGQADLSGVDRKTAAIGAGAVGLVAAKYAGVI
jgi:hypothetical protein